MDIFVEFISLKKKKKKLKNLLHDESIFKVLQKSFFLSLVREKSVKRPGISSQIVYVILGEV